VKRWDEDLQNGMVWEYGIQTGKLDTAGKGVVTFKNKNGVSYSSSDPAIILWHHPRRFRHPWYFIADWSEQSVVLVADWPTGVVVTLLFFNPRETACFSLPAVWR
jgi:hypothetical protein